MSDLSSRFSALDQQVLGALRMPDRRVGPVRSLLVRLFIALAELATTTLIV